jgi:hypothetical protein
MSEIELKLFVKTIKLSHIYCRFTKLVTRNINYYAFFYVTCSIMRNVSLFVLLDVLSILIKNGSYLLGYCIELFLRHFYSLVFKYKPSMRLISTTSTNVNCFKSVFSQILRQEETCIAATAAWKRLKSDAFFKLAHFKREIYCMSKLTGKQI